MSLWYKQVDQITFQDFQDFCHLHHKEGTRLVMSNLGLRSPGSFWSAWALEISKVTKCFFARIKLQAPGEENAFLTWNSERL